MKKFLICFLLLSITLPSNAAFWNKKNKALEQELQGKGYAGNLPDIGEKIERSKTKVTTPVFLKRKKVLIIPQTLNLFQKIILLL